MDVKYVNPFINAAAHVFSKMLGATAQRGAPRLANSTSHDNRIITVIGLSWSGAWRGGHLFL